MLVKFGEALGLTREAMHAAPALGCTRAWLDEFIQRCNNSLVEALAGNNMTAELFNTIVFPRVIKGLKKNYSFSEVVSRLMWKSRGDLPARSSAPQGSDDRGAL